MRFLLQMADENDIPFVYHWQNQLLDIMAINKDNSIVSKTFRAASALTSFVFRLEMYPNGQGDYNTPVLAIKYIDGPSKMISTQLKFAFVHINGISLLHPCVNDNAEFTKGQIVNVFPPCHVITSPQFKATLGLSDTNKQVTVKCTILIPSPYFEYKPSPPVLTMEKRIGSLFDSVLDEGITSRFTDVSLVSNDGKIFRCHRVVLSTSAPFFFESLFESQMAESYSPEIHLPAVNGDALSEILRYIYQNQVIASNLEPLAEQILNASEMYQLDDLKKYCELCLFENVDEANAIHMVKLADLFSLVDLKQKSVCLVAENFEKIGKSQDYIDLMNEKPKLAVEITLHAVQRMNVHVVAS